MQKKTPKKASRGLRVSAALLLASVISWSLLLFVTPIVTAQSTGTTPCAPGQTSTPARPCGIPTPQQRSQFAQQPPPNSCTGNNCGNIINTYINPLIVLLTVVVGIGLAISFVVAAIQYSSAGSDSNKVAAAKDRIRNTIIVLICYLFLASFLNWLVPGGL